MSLKEDIFDDLHIIFVSTEDDKFLVKGGIGTYLGVVTRACKERYPKLKVTWISQSPTESRFDVNENNIQKIYLPKNQSLHKYINDINECIHNIISGANGKIVLEAPDWEGLLFSYYESEKSPNILKVTRLHSSLAVVTSLTNKKIGHKAKKQIDQENRQILASDLISYPTDFIKNETINQIFLENAPHLQFLKIPNCINAKLFKPKIQSKINAIRDLSKISGNRNSLDDYNIFVLGRVEKIKGSDLAIKMAEKVIKEIPNAHFYLIGSYHSRESLKGLKEDFTIEYLQELLSDNSRNNIHFLGQVDYSALPYLMPAADLFIICYLGDNFPGTVAEIGLSCRPLLILLRGGVGEMVHTPKGYAALTISGDRSEEIIRQGSKEIIKHFKNPTPGIDHANRLYKKLIEEYSDKLIVEQMISAYYHILNNRS